MEKKLIEDDFKICERCGFPFPKKDMFNIFVRDERTVIYLCGSCIEYLVRLH